MFNYIQILLVSNRTRINFQYEISKEKKVAINIRKTHFLLINNAHEIAHTIS